MQTIARSETSVISQKRQRSTLRSELYNLVAKHGLVEVLDRFASLVAEQKRLPMNQNNIDHPRLETLLACLDEAVSESEYLTDTANKWG